MIKINHVAIVADDLEHSLAFWRDALGLTLAGTEVVPAEGVEVAFLPVGDSQIEILMPTDDDSGVAQYLA